MMVLFWFNGGKLLASGEEGIMFFNSFRIFNLYKYNWLDIGMGYAIPVIIPRLIILYLGYFINLFISEWIVQALFFFSIIFTGLFSMYLLTKYYIKLKFVAIVASLFYFFNLYSMSQIWNRFLLTGIFGWAYLPLFLYLVMCWMDKGKLNILPIFILSNFLFAFTYGHPAYIITLWVPVLLYALINIFSNEYKYIRFNNLGRILIIILIWIVINIWWLYPYFTIGSGSLSSISSWQTNLESLKGISGGLKYSDLLSLYHGIYMGVNGPWGMWYQPLLIKILTFITFSIVGLGYVINRKKIFSKYLIILALVGWFVCKGTKWPLGYEFYKLLFSISPASAALRNPYEKFGIVWLLPYSIYFGLGVFWLYKRYKPKLGKIIAGTILFLSCGVLVWPMWTGKVFSDSQKVQIPQYYKDTNTFLNNKKDDLRVLSLPMLPGDGVKYTWGYEGVEPSEFLFDKSTIAKILRSKYPDNKYWALYNKFIKGEIDEEFLNQMNIGYFVLHNDMDYKAHGASSSAEVKSILANNPNAIYLQNIGELEIYEYKTFKDQRLFLIKGINTPEYNYQKKYTTKYILNISNATDPYDVIFKTSYDVNWEARINGAKIENHFVVYDYANAWKIDKKGDYTIDIVFKIWPWE